MEEGDHTSFSRKPSKEERLAAKLRENLRRRKAQSREIRDSAAEDLPKSDSDS
ncbi:MAG: hypothetical protein AAGA34_11970 [Pseudomonadota bacterium]